MSFPMSWADKKIQGNPEVLIFATYVRHHMTVRGRRRRRRRRARYHTKRHIKMGRQSRAHQACLKNLSKNCKACVDDCSNNYDEDYMPYQMMMKKIHPLTEKSSCSLMRMI